MLHSVLRKGSAPVVGPDSIERGGGVNGFLAELLARGATHVIGARTFLSAWSLLTQPMRTRMSALLLHSCAPDRNRELRPAGGASDSAG